MSDPASPPETDEIAALTADGALEDEPVHVLEDVHAQDAERLASEPPTVCLNCGSVLPGRFCPDCGQKDQPIQQPAHVFIAESVSEYFGLDGRLWRTIGALLVKPGTLTLAYLAGRRSYYLRPLRIYLSATVLFFFLLSFLDPFAIERQTIQLDPVDVEAPIEADELLDRLDEREDAVTAERDVVLSALALFDGTTSSGVVAHKDSLESEIARLDALRNSLDADESRLSLALEDDDDESYWGDGASDSLVVPRDLDPPLSPAVLVALQDTGRVQSAEIANTIMTGLGEDLPDWMKGDLARRMEDAQSPAERNLLLAEYQRAILRQVPTTLFIVLPIFALLLKVFYVRGGGRPFRHRPSPTDPGSGASSWQRVSYAFRNASWQLGAWRRSRRRRKRLKRNVLVQKRRIRGAPRRAARWIAARPSLRRLRIARRQSLRRGLEGRRARYYSEHLVFALHVHAFTFVCLIPLVLGGSLNMYRGSAQDWISLILVCSIPIYFLVAQYRVYKQTWWRTVVKATTLGFIYLIVISFGAVAAGALAMRLG